MARRRRRLSPETEAVDLALKEARHSAGMRARQADAAARGLRAALKERGRDLTAAYDTVDSTGRAADAAAASSLAHLGAAAEPYKAIVAGESASGIRRATESRARSAGEVGKIGTSIERERGSRYAQIGQDLNETIRKIAESVGEGASERAKQQGARSLERLRQRGQTRGIRLRGSEQRRTEHLKADLKPPSKTKGKGGKGAKLPGTPTQRGKALQILAKHAPPDASKILSKRAGRHKLIGNLITRSGVDPGVASWAVHTYASRLGPKTIRVRHRGPLTPGQKVQLRRTGQG
jgi:hypothetical protein